MKHEGPGPETRAVHRRGPFEITFPNDGAGDVTHAHTAEGHGAYEA